MSVKFQVTLPDSLMAQLKVESRRLKISVAELIRQTMHDSLSKRWKSQKESFFDSITGLITDCKETDLASRVDEILYGENLRRH